MANHCFVCWSRYALQHHSSRYWLCLACRDGLDESRRLVIERWFDVTTGPAPRLRWLVPYSYESILRVLILRTKVRGDHAALRFLEQLFLQNEMVVAYGGWADLIVPAPSSLWGRLRGRLDLAGILTLALARQTGTPLGQAPFALHWRSKKRAKLSPAERRRDDRSISHKWAEPSLAAFHQKLSSRGDQLKILLVDDVVTTGATMRRLAGAFSCKQVAELRLVCLAGARRL